MSESKQHDTALREHLLYLIRGGGAHLSFDDLADEFPAELSGQKVDGLPYTAWQVLEHMVRTQPPESSRSNSVNATFNTQRLAKFSGFRRQQPRERTTNIPETEKTNSVLFHSTPFPLL